MVFYEYSMRCREKVYQSEPRRFLLSRIEGSEQENDLSLPPNCGGYGRIRHFRRHLDINWNDPLPMDPMSKSLNLETTDLVKAQVFQIAACNLSCWYCFVPQNLKSAQTGSSAWFSSDEMLGMFVEEKLDDIRLIDLSGGNPELVPEWIVDTMRALEKRNMVDYIYLWSDDTLTSDIFFRQLTSSDICYIRNYPHYGKVCCFKGFDKESFSFNTGLHKGLFEKQFELFERYLNIGIDLYGYVTFTTDNAEGIEEKIGEFITRLRRIHPLLPLRVVPLKIVMFSPMSHQMQNQHVSSMKNQIIVHNVWRKQLQSIFSSEQLQFDISHISLA